MIAIHDDTQDQTGYGHWRPMETAPKNGKEILCFTRYGDYEISHWRAVTQCWVSKRGFFVEASCWCPLPKPPAHTGAETDTSDFGNIEPSSS